MRRTRLLIVTGVEGSGHRYLCRCLQAAGLKGDATQPEKYDDADFIFTHNPNQAIRTTYNLKMSPVVLCLVREFEAHRKQVEKNLHLEEGGFKRKRQDILRDCLTLSKLLDFHCEIIAYESMCGEAIQALLRRMAVATCDIPKFENANQKHYQWP